MPAKPRPASFVEVVVPPAAREAAGMEVVLPAGYRVRLGDTVVTETLRTVLLARSRSCTRVAHE